MSTIDSTSPTLDLIRADFALLHDPASPPGVMRIVWTGSMCERETDTILAPYFRELVGHACAQRLSLLFDFTELSNFNSSAITALMRLIQKINVKLTFHYDASKKWQRLTFTALRHVTAPAGFVAFTCINAPQLL